jgi:site-specific DNA-methyltransferase (adenine-specific)
MDYMAKCEDNQFDLAIVDPPFGISINKSGRLGHYGGKGKKWDDAIPDDGYFQELFRVSNNQIIWGGNYFSLPSCRGFIIWDKKQPSGVSFADGEYAWSSYDRVARFFRMFPVKADAYRIHPTQKPVELYRWLLQNYAKEGDKILDTHLGSGSIAIACDEMHFDLVGCELDKDYYDAAKKRLEQHQEQIRLF